MYGGGSTTCRRISVGESSEEWLMVGMTDEGGRDGVMNIQGEWWGFIGDSSMRWSELSSLVDSLFRASR